MAHGRVLRRECAICAISRDRGLADFRIVANGKAEIVGGGNEPFAVFGDCAGCIG